MLKDYNSVVVFDFETTGLSSETNEIIEIGILRYEKNDEGRFSLISSCSSLVTP